MRGRPNLDLQHVFIGMHIVVAVGWREYCVEI